MPLLSTSTPTIPSSDSLKLSETVMVTIIWVVELKLELMLMAKEFPGVNTYHTIQAWKVKVL